MTSKHLSAIDALERELKLTYAELVPTSEGASCIPPKLYECLQNGRFTKRSDKPLLAYALFCKLQNGKRAYEEPRIRQRVLKRIGEKDAENNPRIGRALVRGYFEVYTGSMEPSAQSDLLFHNEVKKLVCACPKNHFFLPLFEKTPLELSDQYETGSFSGFLNKLGNGCLDQRSAFSIVIWESVVNRVLKTFSIDFRRSPSETLKIFNDFIFFENSCEFRKPDRSLQMLRNLVSVLNAPFLNLPFGCAAMLLDIAGMVENANIQTGIEEINQCQESIRHIAFNAIRKT